MALWLQEPAAETPQFIFWLTGNRNRTGRGPGCMTSRLVPKVLPSEVSTTFQSCTTSRGPSVKTHNWRGGTFQNSDRNSGSQPRRMISTMDYRCHLGAFLACGLVEGSSLNDSKGSYLVTRMVRSDTGVASGCL